MTNLNDSHQDGHRAGVMTKAETNIADSKAVTNLGDLHQDGHRAGVRTKAENDIGDSEAMTFQTSDYSRLQTDRRDHQDG